MAGQGNIKGNVPVEEYVSISEDFAIGADKNGYAVFKDPVKALDKLMELYSDGINLIQKSLRWIFGYILFGSVRRCFGCDFKIN